MAQKTITFGDTQESGHERISGAMPVAMNVVVDHKGTVRRRPGIATYSGVISDTIDSDGLSGIYVTNGGAIYAAETYTSDIYRSLYKIDSSSSVNISTMGGGSKFTGTERATFAETEALLVLAAGDNIQKVVLDTDATSLLGGSPPKASHVAANSLRLLANDVSVDKTKVRYSDVSIGTSDYSGHEDWSFGGVGLAGFFSAEARPDPVQAIYENTNEVFVFGTTNVQVYTPDPQLAYATVATREFGLSAPYSVIKADQTFAWLDQYRRFVVSDARDFEVISEPIGDTLNSLSTVSDCFGYRVHEDPVDCYVWTFPTDGRTFAYQQGAGWSTWMGYDWTGNNWKRFAVNCHTHDQNTDTNLVGTTAGKVRQLSMGVADDDGDRINAFVTTGFYDHGTDMRKHCKSLRMVFERGTVSGTTAPVGFLQYADEPDQWSDPMEIDLGISNDTQPVVSFRSLGVYRRRAWRFTFSGSVDLVLSKVTEEYDVLDS